MNLFIAVLFLASCSMPINVSQKKVNIAGLGWIGNVKYFIDKKKESQSIIALEDLAPSFSPSTAMQGGSRDQNFPEPIILGNVISLTHLSNDSSS